MYWETLGFTEPPFALTPNPEFLFMSSRHQEAFAHLLFAIDTRAGFIELSGEVGTGKTTVIRTLLGQLSPEKYRTAFIFNPTLSPLGLLQEITREFGLACTGCESHELHAALNSFLLQENGAGHTVVLVIDEAQNLQPDVLEQVRLISNLETEQEKLIQIVLVGQPELNRLLARQELRQLKQRITVRYHLEPMAPTEIHSYIRHRIRVAAGGREPVTFSPKAVGKIARYSGGLPRLINAACDRVLLLAFTSEKREISPGMAREAIADLDKTGFRWKYRFSYTIMAFTLVIAVIAVYVVLNNSQRTVATETITDSAPDSANGVKALQVMLKKTGHYDGTPDGMFDTITEDAVKSFQQAERLLVDGKPGGKTLARLYQRSGGILSTEQFGNRSAHEGSSPR